MDYSLTDHEQTVLTDLRDNGPDAEARHAAIILLSAAGVQPTDIASQLDLGRSTVGRWRRKWREQGLAIFPSLAADSIAADDAETLHSDEPDSEDEADSEPVPGVTVPRLELILADGVGMYPDDAMAEAGRKVLRFHFERMLLNEPGSRLGEDIEAVHDMRVATRRMRSFLRLYKPFFKREAIKPFEKGLRATGAALGRVRDLDVFMDKAQRYLEAHPDVNLTPLFQTWVIKRGKARRKLIMYLDSNKFYVFVREFHKFLCKPGQGAKALPKNGEAVPYQVRHIAPRLIYQHYEVVRAYGPVLDGAPIETLHALRIDFKRFRYALEGFQDVLGPEVTRVIKAVKGMQDHLGDLNDTDVAISVLTTFVEQHQAEFSGIPGFMRPNISGVQQYIQAQIAEQEHLLATFPDAWAAFVRDDVRRDLALAVAAL